MDQQMRIGKAMTDKDTLRSVLEALNTCQNVIERDTRTYVWNQAEKAITSLQALIDKPTADDRLLGALRFYADRFNYASTVTGGLCCMAMDQGRRAREAIEQAEQKGDG